MLFDTFQDVLYSNDPHAQQDDNNEEKAIYEESILMSILGQNYN